MNPVRRPWPQPLECVIVHFSRAERAGEIPFQFRLRVEGPGEWIGADRSGSLMATQIVGSRALSTARCGYECRRHRKSTVGPYRYVRCRERRLSSRRIALVPSFPPLGGARVEAAVGLGQPPALFPERRRRDALVPTRCYRSAVA